MADDNFEALVDALDRLSGEISQKGIVDLISQVAGVERSAAYPIFHAVRLLTDFTQSPNFVKNLVNTLATEKALKDTTRETAVLRLARAQQCKLVKYYTYAIRVIGRNPKNFRSARAITEMRPIFSENVDEVPAAYVIEHQLEIGFSRFSISHQDEVESFFVSLDANDLDTLINILNRCRSKSKTLETQLASNSVAYLKATH